MTAHAALDKAAAFFDMRIIRVPVKADDRADVGAIKRAIGPHTCLIFASACNHITGTVDPIEKIANVSVCVCVGYAMPIDFQYSRRN